VARIVGAAQAESAILPMWQQEQKIIEDALQAFGGNIARAAAALEISPSTIYRKKVSWDRGAA
jgi:two-component system repressor protein LuxO